MLHGRENLSRRVPRGKQEGQLVNHFQRRARELPKSCR